MKAPAATVLAAMLLLASSSLLCAASRSGAELASPRRQLLAQAGMRSAKALLGLDTSNKQLRVLAHGDSITEGWINTLWVKMPWTPKIQQQLQSKLGGDWKIDVVNGGDVTGEGKQPRLLLHGCLQLPEQAGVCACMAARLLWTAWWLVL